MLHEAGPRRGGTCHILLGWGRIFGSLAVGCKAGGLTRADADWSRSQYKSAPSRAWTGQYVPKAPLASKAMLSPRWHVTTIEMGEGSC